MDSYTVLRWVSVALAVAAILRLLIRTRWWMSLTPPLPMHWLGLVGLTVVVGWAALTGAVEGRPGGTHVAAITVALLWLNVAAWWPTPGRRQRHAVRKHQEWRNLR